MRPFYFIKGEDSGEPESDFGLANMMAAGCRVHTGINFVAVDLTVTFGPELWLSSFFLMGNKKRAPPLANGLTEAQCL